MKRIINFLKNTFTILYRVRHLVRRELQMKESVPWNIRFKMWSKGFLAVSYYRYNFPVNNHEMYISDYTDNIHALDLSAAYYVYLDNKLLFPVIAKNRIPIAVILGGIMDGDFIRLNDELNINSFEQLLQYVKTTSSVFIKPNAGSTGGNIVKLQYLDNRLVLNNSDLSDEQVIAELKKIKESLIQPTVVQHEYASKIFPKTTNTIRILTTVDPETKMPFIAHAVHRFGRSSTFPVDNFARGGISCDIDIETGIIKKGAYIYPASKNIIWHSVHPESQMPLEGVQIPYWNAVKEDILKVAKQFSFMSLVGWDIVITKDKYVLLEGNHGPDVKVHQIHVGLLTDPRMVKFYRHHKIIK